MKIWSNKTHFNVGDGSPVPFFERYCLQRDGKPVPYNGLLIIIGEIIHSLKYRVHKYFKVDINI